MSEIDRPGPLLATQAIGEPVSGFTLQALGGGTRSLGEALAGRRGALVLFWSGVCSHCARYDGYLNGFTTRHPQIALVVVASRQEETPESLQKTVAARGLGFPLLVDADRAVAHRFLVRQTPRAFLLDAGGRLLYRGAIDNYKYPEDPAYEGYLETALAAFAAGRPLPRAETPSFGCPVESVYYALPKPLRAAP